MAQCDIQQCLCHIATFIKVDVILRHSRVLWHYDIHEGCGWIVAFKSYVTLQCGAKLNYYITCLMLLNGYVVYVGLECSSLGMC